MPISAWIVGAGVVLGLTCAVFWALIRLAAGRAKAQADADSAHAALEISQKVIDAQSRPDPDDAELDRWLRQPSDRA
jgi:hypothetical protein